MHLLMLKKSVVVSKRNLKGLKFKYTIQGVNKLQLMYEHRIIGKVYYSTKVKDIVK